MKPWDWEEEWNKLDNHSLIKKKKLDNTNTFLVQTLALLRKATMVDIIKHVIPIKLKLTEPRQHSSQSLIWEVLYFFSLLVANVEKDLLVVMPIHHNGSYK